jgi:hypothetical protein
MPLFVPLAPLIKLSKRFADFFEGKTLDDFDLLDARGYDLIPNPKGIVERIEISEYATEAWLLLRHKNGGTLLLLHCSKNKSRDIGFAEDPRGFLEYVRGTPWLRIDWVSLIPLIKDAARHQENLKPSEPNLYFDRLAERVFTATDPRTALLSEVKEAAERQD